MGKFLLNFFLIVLITLISIVIFLTYIGLETDKFDNIIKNKTNEINRNVKLDFKKTKIHLNPTELNLVVKLQKPKILIKRNEIDLSKFENGTKSLLLCPRLQRILTASCARICVIKLSH